MGGEPLETRKVIREHEHAGFTACPEYQAAMHQRIRGSQLRIIEDASHLCFAEQPEEFNKVINSFMT